MNTKALLLAAYGRVLRSIKPNSGLTPLCHNAVVDWLAAELPGVVDSTTSDGYKIVVSPKDYDGRILMLTGSNDFKVSRVVNALLSPGDVFLDIGANYSTIGLKAAGRVRPGGHVHLFEPQPALADAVQAAIEAAGLQQLVSLHRLALYDRDGTMMMRIPASHSGMATIAPQQQRDTSDWTTAEVCTRSARDCVSELTRGQRFGVKIDVEGAEPAILPGLLEVGKMMFCVFEGDRNQEKIFQMFSGAGYQVYGLCKTLLFPRLSIVNTLSDWPQFHDFLAVPADIRIDRQRFPLPLLAAAMQARPNEREPGDGAEDERKAVAC